MRAVVFRVVRRVRAARVATTVSVALVAVAVGTVLALAAGAHRTATAPDRYEAAIDFPYDAQVTQGYGPPLTDEVARLPGVDAASSITFVFGGISLEPEAEPTDALVFAGDPTSQSLHVIDGRLAAAPGEMVVTDTFARRTGARVGDVLTLLTYSQAAAEAGAFGVSPPDRPPQSVTLVGVVGGRPVGDPTKDLESLAYVPFAAVEGTDTGIVTTLMSVELHDGVDLTALRTELDGLSGRPGADALTVEPLAAVSDTVRTAVRMQAVSLWLMAVIAGAAAVVALGQLVGRGARLAPDDDLTLRSLGYGTTQLVVESLVCAAVVIVCGTVLGAVGAPFASSIFPTGFVGRMEPNPGFRLDLLVVVLGALAMAAALVLWVGASLLLRRSRSRPATPPAVATRLASVSFGPAVTTGARLAFARTGREAGSVRSSAAGLAVAVATVVGAFTVGSSMHRLVAEPARFGANYDLYFGQGSLPPGLTDELAADPDIDGITLVSEGQVDVDDTTLRVLGLDVRRGQVTPRLLDGRLPAAADEIALGSVEARRLRVGIDDRVELRGTAGTCTCLVTGLVVIPSVGVNAGVGRDGVLTGDGFRRLVADSEPTIALTDLARGSGDELERLVTAHQATPADAQLPPDVIANLSHATGAPDALALLLAALAVVGVAHAATLSVRRRRRDVAVLAALGAERSWLRTMSHWQITAGAIVPVAGGVPLGLVVGTLVFRRIADSIGAIPAASVPLLRSAAVGVAVVVVANAIALVPARRARRASPAATLAAE